MDTILSGAGTIFVGFCAFTYFSFWIFSIYSIFKIIHTISKSIYSGRTNYWVEYGIGLSMTSDKPFTEKVGEILITLLPGLGFSFLIYLVLFLLPDFFDRGRSLKMSYDVVYSGVIGIGFYYYLNSKKISGSILNEVRLGRSVDLHDIECEILLRVIFESLDEKMKNRGEFDEEEILDLFGIRTIVDEMQGRVDCDENLKGLISFAIPQLQERINSSSKNIRSPLTPNN